MYEYGIQIKVYKFIPAFKFKVRDSLSPTNTKIYYNAQLLVDIFIYFKYLIKTLELIDLKKES